MKTDLLFSRDADNTLVKSYTASSRVISAMKKILIHIDFFMSTTNNTLLRLKQYQTLLVHSPSARPDM